MYKMKEEKEMGKVKAWAMDCEEMFWDGAQDVVIECENYEQFVEVMKPQLDLVVHLDKQEIDFGLSDIWGEYVESTK